MGSFAFDPSQLKAFDPSQLKTAAPSTPEVSFDPSQLRAFDPSQLSSAPPKAAGPQIITPEEYDTEHPKAKGPLIMSTERKPLPSSFTHETTFSEARQQAAEQVGKAVDENLPFLVGPFRLHAGIIKAGAEAVTDPVSLGIMAGTAGLGAVPGAAARTLETGLSAYFATKAGQSFIEKAPEVKEAVKSGDWQKAAELGGGALADAVIAYSAANHVKSSWDRYFDSIEAHNAAAQADLEKEQEAGKASAETNFLAKKITGEEGIPVQIGGKEYTVRAGETNLPPGSVPSARKPVYDVVDPDGKVVRSGSGGQISDYLGKKNATPAGVGNVAPADLDAKYSEVVAERAEAQSSADQAKAAGKRDLYAEAVVKDADVRLSDIQKQRAQAGAPGTQLPQAQRETNAAAGETTAPTTESSPANPANTETPGKPTFETRVVVPEDIQAGAQVQDKAGRTFTVKSVDGHGRVRSIDENGEERVTNLPQFARRMTAIAASTQSASSNTTAPPVTATATQPSQEFAPEQLSTTAPAETAATPAPAVQSNQAVAAPAEATAPVQPATPAAAVLPPAAIPPAPATTQGEGNALHVQKLEQAAEAAAPAPAAAPGPIVSPTPESAPAPVSQEFAPEQLSTTAPTQARTPQFPWQQTPAESGLHADEHRAEVVDAIRRGEDVPAEVRAAFPEVSEKGEVAASKTEGKGVVVPTEWSAKNRKQNPSVKSADNISPESKEVKEGDEVTFTKNGKQVTGVVTDLGTDDEGEPVARIRSGGKKAGGVPIGRVDRVPVKSLNALPAAGRSSTWKNSDAPSWWKTAFGTESIDEPWEVVRDAYVRRMETDPSFGQTMMDYAGDWADGKAEAGADRRTATQVEKPATQVEASATEQNGATVEGEDNAPVERQAEPGVEAGRGTERFGDQNSEALAGVPAEDVQGAPEGQSSVSVSRPGGETDGRAAGETAAGEPVVREGAGNGVQGVVPPAGRAGTAKSDFQSVNAPSGSLDADFGLTPEEAGAIENGGARTKARSNIAAIKLIKKLESEQRTATLDEQKVLARYVGWGDSELANGLLGKYGPKREWQGLFEDLEPLLTPDELEAARRSTINAHYTRRDVAHSMWLALQRMGFGPGGSVIEPGMGIGNFFMMMPEHLRPGTRRTGVEMDLLTGGMAKQLYPGSNIIIKPYQETNLPEGYFDAAIGNVPFQGGINIYDPQFKREPYLTNGIHNYFFAKTLTKLRPGGVMLLITSRGTMDSTEAKPFRQWMAKHAVLLGAVRLPADTFKANAGTSVTVDVVAIRKRVPNDPLFVEGEESGTPNPWVNSAPHTMENGQQVNINEYFQTHPEMMMGKMEPGTMYHRGYPELKGEFSLEKFDEMLARLPANMIPSWASQAQSASLGTLVEDYPDAQFIKEGQLAFVNGALVRRNGAYMEPVPYTGTRLDRAKALIAIRGAAREVIRTQRLELGEKAILDARKELNREYDKFVKTNIGKTPVGAINSYANTLVMADDPDWALLSSLEDYDKKTKKAVKRAMFSERTIVRPTRVETAETGSDALAVSLNELGRIDWDRMQELTGRTPDELRGDLEGKIFRNPITKAWETADEYLSGNVRKKLKDAEFARDNEDPKFAANAEVLKGVVPRDLQAGDIDAFIGGTWIPGTTYEDFAREVLRTEGVSVKLVPLTGGYAVNENHIFTDKGVANNIEYGTPYFSGMELFQMSLNGNVPVARDEYTDFNGTKRTMKNPKETIKAVEKQRRIQDEFTKWMWSDPARATTMARKYNDERNNLKLREFDGSHLTFPGLNRSWLRGGDLDAHQKNAVWRIIQSGNSLLAHVVGAGKTLEMVAATMELKRMGLARKPMAVVPNHLVAQWRDDFLRAYPSAQILVPTKRDFEAKNRRKLMAKIATGNYDAVIVGHKPFELLPVKNETFKQFMDEQIEEIENALDAMREGKSKSDQYKDPTIKQLTRRKTALEERLKKRTSRETKDQSVTFEELGVDWLFVDEAHAYKNLGYMTMMDRVAGLPNSDANRSVDMLLKSTYIRKLHGTNRGVVFASGTPVSNSIAETWTMMRYLMPDYLKEEGMDQFDAWAKTFGKTTTNMEVAPEGGRMISRTRFAEFANAPELMNMFRLVADIRTRDQLNLPTPAIATGGAQDVVVPASRQLKAYIASIGERADAIRRGDVKDPSIDNMLKISSDARKASLDMRLVHPSAKEDLGSKANAAIKNILEIYKKYSDHKAAQLVFLDLSTPKAEKGASRRKKTDVVANIAAETPAPEVENQAVANTGEDESEPEEMDLYGDSEEQEQDTDTAEESAQRFTVYSQIKKKLVAGGIPEAEIAFIHDYKTDAQKKQLFDDMNAGHMRVLLGSTEKMGAGMNVQKRLVALHHLDAPWKPSDVEQREGRIDRQGNMLWDQHQIPVNIFRYMTEGSFDAFMWQTVVAKARPITLLMNGDPAVRRVEEMGPVVASYEQAMAISSGNPLVKEKIILDQDIQKIEILRGGWLTEQSTINQTLSTLPGEMKRTKRMIEELKSDIATRDANQTLVVGGKEYAGLDIRKEGAAALVNAVKAMGPVSEIKPVGATYRGFNLETSPRYQSLETRADASDKSERYVVDYVTAEDGSRRPLISSVGSIQNGATAQKEAFNLKPVSKSEAERLWKAWNSKDGGLTWMVPDVQFWVKPELRLKAESSGYPVSVNYESPAGTITSADHYVRGFEESLTSIEGNLRRLEKQKVELESKQGLPFRDEEKLRKMLTRQAELETILGENKDDVQAVGADDEEEDTNPLTPLLKDQTSAMEPKWFPSRQIYITGAHGEKSAEKVYTVTPDLAVMETKAKNDGTWWSVIHEPTGTGVTRFRSGIDAVAFARQAEKARNWNYTVAPDKDAFADWLHEFKDKEFKAPTETPAESVARLTTAAEPVADAGGAAAATAGPISAYKPGRKKPEVPEYNRGEKGWLHVDIDGKKYSMGGSYIIAADIQPAAKDASPIPPAAIKKLLGGVGDEKRTEPLAFSTTGKGKDEKRWVWFSPAVAIPATQFDDINKRYPGAHFMVSATPARPVLVNDAKGERVGATMPIKNAPIPEEILNILKPGERGSAPALTDLIVWLDKTFGKKAKQVDYQAFGSEDEPVLKRHYNYVGAFKSKFGTGAGLSEVRMASPAAWRALVKMASADVVTRVAIRRAELAINRELEHGPFNINTLIKYYSESRLQGIRDRWTEFAQQAADMTDGQLDESYNSAFNNLLQAVENKRGIPQYISQTAESLAQRQDWGSLRDLLTQTFEDASDLVAELMEPDEFDRVRDLIADDKHAAEADRIYGASIESLMAEYHSEHEGVMATALGPAGRYVPLTGVVPEIKKGARRGAYFGIRRPFKRPRNERSLMATGISRLGYDTSLEALEAGLTRAVRNSSKFQAIEAMENAGLLKRYSREAPETFRFQGENYPARRIEISPPRTMLVQENGATRSVRLPAQMAVTAPWIYNEVRPILDAEHLDDNLIQKVMDPANAAAIFGPTLALIDSHNILSTLTANTPFLGATLVEKVASAPLLKRFSAALMLARQIEPLNEAAFDDLIHMAKIGALPAKYGAKTWSKKIAEQSGAERAGWWNFTPFLYGPAGIDVRARLKMYRIAKALNPGISDEELHDFINQIGTYLPGLQSSIERSLKKTGLAPFYTRGAQMMINGIHTWTGTGPMPKKGWQMRLATLITGGAIMLIATWLTVSKLMGWKPVGLLKSEVNIPEDVRASKLGHQMGWDKNGTTVIDFSLWNPLVARGARALGLLGAADTLMDGGNWWQAIEYGTAQSLSTIGQPALGPIPRSVFVGVMGVQPYLTAGRDRSGHIGPQFFPAVPPRHAGLRSFAERIGAAAFSANAMASQLGQAQGFTSPDQDPGGRYLKMISDLALPGANPKVVNLYSRQQMLYQQRTGTK